MLSWKTWFKNVTMLKKLHSLGALGFHGVFNSGMPLPMVSQVRALNFGDEVIYESRFLHTLSNICAIFLGLDLPPLQLLLLPVPGTLRVLQYKSINQAGF